MNEEEHKELVKELENKWIDKLTPDNTKIIGVYVDYRKEHQEMNRVQDEYGNIYFISELKDSDVK